MLKRISLLLTMLVCLVKFSDAQITTSGMTGFIKGKNGEALVGATVTLTHVPTGTVSRTQTKSGGKYDISNLNPGGPYTLVVSYVNFETVTRDEIYLTLGEFSKQDVEMTTSGVELSTVVVAARRAPQKSGVETNISRERISVLPTVGRNITDLLRSVPQAKLTSTEGAVSIAGQNNRFNAFYIDGALNNDVFGLAASGTNGGQANVPPISLDAIDQIQVSISPWDASLGGFTGGGINAITRSGTNNLSGSVYYLMRNEKLTGKTPTGKEEAATKLGDFNDRVMGFRIGGALIKNKLFFFINPEIVRFERPQTFDFANYRGNSTLDQVNALANTLRNTYKYEPGGFLNNPEKVEADRIVTKLDYNISDKHKATVSYRYNKGERTNTSSSSNSTINFFNNGYIFPSTSHTLTGELRSSFTKTISNRFMVTYTDVEDNRDPIGQRFPRVRINDGSGAIVFGPDNSSTINLLTQKNFNFFDAVRFNLGKHSVTVGTDNETNKIYNAFIQNTFGNYTYANMDSFLNNSKPSNYSVGYPLIDNKTDETTAAAAKFNTFRAAFFVNDEYRPTSNLTLNFALRADKFVFQTAPKADAYTNDVALPQFQKYYNLEGARSGRRPTIPWEFSPRAGFTLRIPDENVTIRGGIGYFTGRVPLVWPAGIYNSNGINQGGFSASSSQNASALNIIRFRSNPDSQWKAENVGLTISKGPLNLISEKFRLPKVLRSSLGIDKMVGKGWTISLEGFVTKNVNEINYTNINLLPPIGVSVGPGSRNVYPQPNVVPITVGSNPNPYDNAILLSNVHGNRNKGFSYNFTASIDKRYSNGFTFNANYNYGDAVVLHEQTSSVNLSQWRFMESINGRNFLTRSTSDFSPGHRVFALISKKFSYVEDMLATTVSLVYTGQSGAPFSYVYSNVSTSVLGPVRDDIGNDLIYVPTASELQGMTFTTTSPINGVVYTPQQQKDALESFIQNNKYLSKRRGQFAERNGDRLKATHIVDLRLAQDVNIRFGGKRIQFQLTYDMFNFTNFLNREWGRTYFILNDNQPLIQFDSYVSATNLTPRYRFNPTLQQPQSENFISTSSAPTYSARWTSQLGFRINF